MKKRHFYLRILGALLFLALSGAVMYTIYTLSAEDGEESNSRSTIVTEKIKQEINRTLDQSKDGIKLKERIKYFVIMHSPYGSNWNANIRKLAHFSIYFCLAATIYITLAILGVRKFTRFFLTVGICFLFACGDEYHQQFTGRTASMNDVYLDTFGAFLSACVLTVVSWMGSTIRSLRYANYDDTQK